MAFSLFSDKKSSEPKKEEIIAMPVSAPVRTMEQDIEDIKNHKEGGVTFSQRTPEVTKQPSKENTPLSQPMNPFNKEGEKLFRGEITGKNTENPFGVEGKPQKIQVAKADLTQQNVKPGLAPTVLEGEMLTIQGKKNHWLAISVIVLVSFLLIAGGAYYYYVIKGNSGSDVVAPQASVQEAVPPEDTVEILPKESQYALDKPNYLSINTETVSPEDIRATLSQTATRIKDASIASPIEFLVTDQNNNVLAFSRFVFLLKLEVPSEMLALIDENFSLYGYNDGGYVRFGLDLTLKDQGAIEKGVVKIEKSLPYLLRALYLEPGVSISKSVIFKSNTYKSIAVTNSQAYSLRYANIDIPKKLSLDYSIVNNHWYIGTSRYTLTSMLERIVR